MVDWLGRRVRARWGGEGGLCSVRSPLRGFRLRVCMMPRAGKWEHVDRRLTLHSQVTWLHLLQKGARKCVSVCACEWNRKYLLGSTDECPNDPESIRRDRLFELVPARLLSLRDEGACFRFTFFCLFWCCAAFFGLLPEGWAAVSGSYKPYLSREGEAGEACLHPQASEFWKLLLKMLI